MFDIGFWEILLILVLALVVIGPERLPGAARQAGFFIGKARRYIEGVRSEVESELDVGEFKRMLHNQEVQINELQQQLKSGIDNVKSELPDVGSGGLMDDIETHTISDDASDHADDDAGSDTSAPSSDSQSSDSGNSDVSSKSRSTD
jgi:sec-independent protein translocase protein TatB